MWRPAEALAITAEQRRDLESLVRSRTTQQRVVMRAQVVLAAADGKPNRVTAQELNVSRSTVLQWRARFTEGGVEALLHDAPRSGRPRRIDAKKVEAVVEATLRSKPKGATHWSTRTLADAQGNSPAWRSCGMWWDST